MHKDIFYGSEMVNKLRLAYPKKNENEISALTYLAIYASRTSCAKKITYIKKIASGATMDTEFMNQIFMKYRSFEDVQEWKITGENAEKIFIVKDNIRAFILKDNVENQISSFQDEVMLLNFPLIELYRQPGFIVRHGKNKISSNQLTRVYLNL